MQDQGLGQSPDGGAVDEDFNTLLLAGFGFEADEGVGREIVHVDLLQVDLGDVREA